MPVALDGLVPYLLDISNICLLFRIPRGLSFLTELVQHHHLRNGSELRPAKDGLRNRMFNCDSG